MTGLKQAYLHFPLDIDECKMYNGVCHGGSCINTIGSFRCSCTGGFRISDDLSTCMGEWMLCRLWKDKFSVKRAYLRWCFSEFWAKHFKILSFKHSDKSILYEKKTIFANLKANVHRKHEVHRISALAINQSASRNVEANYKQYEARRY